MNLLDNLERLARLRERGVLTEEEFQTEKHKLLSSASAAATFTTPIASGEGTPIQNDSEIPKGAPPPHSFSPEFSTSPPTPATQSPGYQVTTDQTPKSNPRKILRRVIVGIAAVFGAFVLIRLVVPFLFTLKGRDILQDVVVMRPQPVVVTFDCDNKEASLFEYRITVRGIIRNTGADGYVRARITVTQGGRDFTRYDRRYMRKDEEWQIVKTFEEPESGGERITCDLDAIAADN